MGLHISTGRFGAILLVAPVVVVVLALLASPYYGVAVGVAAALFGALALMRYPALAFYAIVAMIPFGAFRKVMVGGLEIKLDWVAAGALLFGMIMHYATRRRREGGKLKSHLWFPLVLFFGVSAISAFLSPYPELVASELQLLVVSYLLIMLTLFYVTRRGLTGMLPVVLSGSIALSAFLGAIGYVFDIPFFAEHVTEGPFKRALGGTNDANTLSMMIVFGAPLIGYLLLQSRHAWQRLLLAFMVISCLVAKVVTFSRGGAALLVVTVLAFLGLHRHRLNIHARNVGLVAGIGGIMVTILLCMIPQAYWLRGRALTEEGGDRSVRRRVTYLYVAAKAFTEAPILGHGPGSFPMLYAKSDYSALFAKVPEDRFRRAHNTYVEVLTGTGLLGLALFGSILLIALRDFRYAAEAATRQGDTTLAEWIKTYRLSFLMLLAYLLIFSDLQSKHLLLSLGLSQVALRVAREGESEATA